MMATVSRLKQLCKYHSSLDIFRSEAARQISAVCGVPCDKLIPLLESCRDSRKGDMMIAIPQLKLAGNPTQLATEISERIQLNKYIVEVTNSGPFLNLRICKKLQRDILLPSILKQGQAYGQSEAGKGKKVLVEFSSPNIAKPFHAGHLRSTIIGNFIAKAHAANGYKTITMNYLGDWGKQYGILALGFFKYGSEEELLKDPIKHLFNVYVKINADAESDATIHDQARSYFKRMEDGDQEVLSLWTRFRDLSIEKYKEIYARLNIHFDVYSGESQVDEYMDLAYNMMVQKGLIKDSQGAKIIDLEEYKLGKVVIRKSDGTTLYITRDIGAAIQRYETYKFDKMYYVVASQQDLHLKQLFKILELLELDWAKNCHHINFGMVTGMSTRKGNVVFLDDILREANDTMHTVMQKNQIKYAQIDDPRKVADLVGISAVVIQDMTARRIKNYEFNMEQMVSFEGDTGPYLQYAHSRLSAIIRKVDRVVDPNMDLSTLTEPCAHEVIDILVQYPTVVKRLLDGLEPSSVVTYSLRLARALSACLEQLYVLNQPDHIALPRLALYSAARTVLGNSLRLIGLTPLDRI